MALHITVECNGCGETEEITPDWNMRIEDIDVEDELDWVQDPDEPEKHYCGFCASERNIGQQEERVLAGHPDPARALPPAENQPFHVSGYPPIAFRACEIHLLCSHGHTPSEQSILNCKDCARIGING